RNFHATQVAFEKKIQRLGLAVHRTAVQDIAQRSHTPIAQGGKMPVDTGFLRASQAGSRVGPPHGTGRGERDVSYTTLFAGPIELVAMEATLRSPVWIGWTANYARFMEARYGFMRSEAQNWAHTVDKAIARVALTATARGL